MPDILSLLSIAFLPLLITIILVWGIWKKVPIYDTFIKGAKDGVKTSVEILPFLLGIFLAIGALTSSGAMGFLQETTRPFFEKIGIPQELISLILLRPVSGSGSLVLAQQIMAVTRLLCRKSCLRHGRKLRNGILRPCSVFWRHFR